MRGTRRVHKDVRVFVHATMTVTIITQKVFRVVESAIGARRIRSILKSGMCSLTTFLQEYFCSDV